MIHCLECVLKFRNRMERENMRMLICTLFVLSLLFTTGCFKQNFVNSDKQAASQPAVDMWQSHFLLGLISGDDINLNEICPSGVAEVKEHFSFANGLVGALTLSIYGPSTVVVYCADGTAKTLEVNENQTEVASIQ